MASSIIDLIKTQVTAQTGGINIPTQAKDQALTSIQGSCCRLPKWRLKAMLRTYSTRPSLSRHASAQSLTATRTPANSHSTPDSPASTS